MAGELAAACERTLAEGDREDRTQPHHAAVLDVIAALLARIKAEFGAAER